MGGGGGDLARIRQACLLDRQFPANLLFGQAKKVEVIVTSAAAVVVVVVVVVIVVVVAVVIVAAAAAVMQ